MRPFVLLLSALATLAAAQPAAPALAGAPAIDLRPLMLDRAELLFAESFAPGEWEKRWGRGARGWQAGTWEGREGAVRCAPVAAENHHPALPYRIALSDVVVQFAFKFEDADCIFLGFDDKEHVARLFIRRDGIEISRMTGIGKTTKGETIDKAPARFEAGRWYTAAVELSGTDLLAQVDERYVVYGQKAGLDQPKGRIELMCHGGKGIAWFDEVKIFKPATNADWEKTRKPKLLEMMKKRRP